MWSKTYPALLPYFGGKGIIASDVWRWFGRPRTYCEPFCGSAKMLFARPKSSLPKGKAIEIINDTNGYVANAWRAIKYAKDEVAEYVINLYSEVDVHARHAWLINNSDGLVPRLEGDPAYHSPRIAGYWIWGMSAHIGQGFASGRGPWNLAMDDEGYQVLVNIGDKNAGISRQLPSVTGRGVITLEPDEVYAVLDRYASRLRDVMVVCGDWTRVVTTGVLYNTPAAIFFDPPYRDASRKSESTLYASDGDDIAKEVEVWAIENGDNPDYRIALCGYEGDYDMPDGWNVIEWTANHGFSTGESPRDKERVWLSPHCATNEHKQLSLLDGG